jgi:hypothetical protein
MRKVILASVATLALAYAAPAFAGFTNSWGNSNTLSAAGAIGNAAGAAAGLSEGAGAGSNGSTAGASAAESASEAAAGPGLGAAAAGNVSSANGGAVSFK